MLGQRKVIDNKIVLPESVTLPIIPNRSEKLLQVSEAAKKYRLKIEDILICGANGVITLCMQVNSKKFNLWIRKRASIDLMDPECNEAYRFIQSAIEKVNKDNLKCLSRDRIEWLVLSKNDCKRLLKVETYVQSYFETGWAMNEENTLERIYPRYSFSCENEKYNTMDCTFLTFEFHKRDDRFFDINSGSYEYCRKSLDEFVIDRTKLLITREEIDIIIDFINKKEDDLVINSLLPANDEFVAKYKHCNYSEMLDYLVELSKHFLVKLITTKGAKIKYIYKSNEIAGILTGEHSRPEKFNGHKHLTRDIAELAASLITPKNISEEALRRCGSSTFITPDLNLLVELSSENWSKVDVDDVDIRPIKQKIISKLEESGFSPTNAKLAERLIRPHNLPEQRGRPKSRD